MRTLIVAGALMFGFSALGQSGPGGIGSSTENNFWLDANSLSMLDNENIAQFTDVSGNNNTFTQLNSVKQPIYKTNIVNGMPVIRFDGVDDNMLSSSISALESSNVTWFIVYKQNVQKTCGIIASSYASESKKWRSYALSNGVFKSVHYSPSIVHVGYNDNYSSFNFSSSHATPGNMKVYKEGVLTQTKNSAYTTPSSHNFVALGSFASMTHFLNGDVAEAFVFNSSLNSLERIIIENYLGAKYNLTIPQDFYSFQAIHKYGVIGLGNDAVNTHTESTGNGILTVENPTLLSLNEYMFIGHNGTDLSVIVNSDMPAAVSTDSRLSRTWRVDETGDMGSVTLKFDVSGSAGFAQTATYNLLVDADGDGDFSNSTTVAGVFNAGIMEFTTNLPSGAAFTLSGLPTVPAAIHSIASGSWYTLSTWDCACIPSLTDTIYIEPTHNVDLDGDAFVHSLIVTSTGVLEMSQDFLLSIKGDLNVSGLLTLTNGEIGFTGNSSQSLSGNGGSHNLNNILLNNGSTSDVTFTNGEYILNDVLNPLNGSLVIDNAGGGSLVINSTSNSTGGRIGVLTATSSILGNVTVRRFLPAGVAGERDISSPVIGANLSEWDADISMSGSGFPDGCAAGPDGCYFSVKRYIGGDLTDDYIDVTNPNETLISGVGYEVFLGDNINTYSGATIKSTGVVRDYQNYTINFPTIKSGWNIIGNPYVSPILFSQMNTSHMGNYFYVYDAASGGYQWYDGAANTSSIPELANGIIAIGQGIWIYGGGVPEVDFTQSLKTSNNATFIRNAQSDESILLSLNQEGTTYKNSIGVAFSEFSNDGFDSLDVQHLMMSNQKASALVINTQDKKLAKNYLTEDGLTKVVDLSINIFNQGYFTIEASNIENENRYSNIKLIDNFTRDIIDLKKYNSYTFYSVEGEYERFQLILSNEVIVNNENSIIERENNESDLTITQLGNAIKIESTESIEGITEISIINLLGQEEVHSESINLHSGTNMIVVPGHLSGIYLVVIKSVKGLKTKKIML
jgi:hypothetical protein